MTPSTRQLKQNPGQQQDGEHEVVHHVQCSRRILSVKGFKSLSDCDWSSFKWVTLSHPVSIDRKLKSKSEISGLVPVDYKCPTKKLPTFAYSSKQKLVVFGTLCMGLILFWGLPDGKG